ncbi:MAG TPA: CinA family protein [Methanomassiliicoccales archaeon]|nr:CinA family protein [Methanomassiliicoccales archaeon]
MLETDILGRLGKAGLTLAVAESCTGGRICDRITDVPGSSEHFKGGVVVYSNDSKVRFLGVSHETLKIHGAVSEECAREMASGVAKAFGADIGVSVTGIAGPGGATPQKPVGLVFIGIAMKKEQAAFQYLFDGDRKSIKAQATEQALRLVLDFIPCR